MENLSLQHVDFYPRRKLGKSITSNDWDQHENLFEILERANAYLLDQANQRLVFVESVVFCMVSDYSEVLKQSPSFCARGERPKYYAHGIRVWISSELSDRPSQLSILHIVPECTYSDPYNFIGFRTQPLDVLLHSLNELPDQDEMFSPDNVINVQSVNLEYSCEWRLQPERTVWRDKENARQTFVVILRIFYRKGCEAVQASTEKILIHDFLPRVLLPEFQWSKPEHSVVESFSMIFNRVREFLRLSPPAHFRIINIQTLKFRQEWMEIVDTQKTNYNEDNMRMYQIKYLRLVIGYTSDDFNPGNITSLYPGKTLRLNYKTFVPRLTKYPTLWRNAEFESTVDFERRVTEWLSLNTYVRVISSESVTMRVFSGAEALEGLDTMHTWNRVVHHSTAAHTHHHNFLHGRTHHRHGVRYREASVARETFVMILRIYYDGVEASESTQDRQNEDALTDFMAARQAGSTCCVS